MYVCLFVFLLDGQKIAIKLSKQVGKQTKQLKSLVQEYGVCLPDDDSAAAITMEEVLDTIKLEERLRVLGVWCLGTVPEKREAMDAYLMLSRSREEQSMLKHELQRVISFYESKRDHIRKACSEVLLLADSLYNRGISSLLHRLLQQVTNALQEAKNTLHSFDQEDESELYWCDSDLDDDSDEDDNCTV